MIYKINQFRGGDESNFPKIGILEGSKADIVEIQKGERNLLREQVGIEDDMDLDEMQALLSGKELWVICQTQMRTVKTLLDPPADAQQAYDANGDEIENGYVVPAYPVNVVSYIAIDVQDAIAHEQNHEDLEKFVKSLELKTSQKTADLAAKMAKMEEATQAKQADAASKRAEENKARLLAFRAKKAGKVLNPTTGIAPEPNPNAAEVVAPAPVTVGP